MADSSRKTTILGLLVIVGAGFFFVLAGQELREGLLNDSNYAGWYFMVVMAFAVFIAGMAGVLFPDLLASRLARHFLPDEGEKQRKAYAVPRGLRAQRRYREAVDSYLQSAAESPADATPLLEAATVYVENLKEGGAAVELFRRALQVSSDEGAWAYASHRMADILLEQDRREEARQVLNQLANRFPTSEPAVRARERLARLGG